MPSSFLESLAHCLVIMYCTWPWFLIAVRGHRQDKWCWGHGDINWGFVSKCMEQSLGFSTCRGCFCLLESWGPLESDWRFSAWQLVVWNFGTFGWAERTPPPTMWSDYCVEIPSLRALLHLIANFQPKPKFKSLCTLLWKMQIKEIQICHLVVKPLSRLWI